MPFGLTPTELQHTHTHRGVFIHLSAALSLSGCVHTLSACFIKPDALLCRRSARRAAKSGFQIR